jgi:hypothetical protein
VEKVPIARWSATTEYTQLGWDQIAQIFLPHNISKDLPHFFLLLLNLRHYKGIGNLQARAEL